MTLCLLSGMVRMTPGSTCLILRPLERAQAWPHSGLPLRDSLPWLPPLKPCPSHALSAPFFHPLLSPRPHPPIPLHGPSWPQRVMGCYSQLGPNGGTMLEEWGLGLSHLEWLWGPRRHRQPSSTPARWGQAESLPRPSTLRDKNAQPRVPQPTWPIGGQGSRGDKPEFLVLWLSLSSPSALSGLSFPLCE